MSIQSANNFLDIILLLGLTGAEEEDMLDLIYQTMDAWMRAGQFSYCAHVLHRMVDESLVGELPLIGLVALASITLVARRELGADRADFMKRVREHVSNIDPERVEALLSHLE